MSASLLPTALAALSLLALPIPGLAQVPALSNSDREQLEQLNSRWLKSYESRDRAALEGVLSDDFIGIYGPRALSKAQMLAGLADRPATRVTWADLQISVNGDTAVVTAISTIATGQGQDSTTARYRYADVYLRRSGQWRAIASHVVRLDG